MFLKEMRKLTTPQAKVQSDIKESIIQGIYPQKRMIEGIYDTGEIMGIIGVVVAEIDPARNAVVLIVRIRSED